MARGAKSAEAARLMARFHGLERAHGTYAVKAEATGGKVKVKGRAKTLMEPVTETLWRRHLAGELGLGVVPINDDAAASFGAIDVDVYDGLDLVELGRVVARHAFPLTVCRTKSGGAHLYLFTSEPAPASLVRAKLMEWAVVLGHPSVEVFPKQVKLASREDVGNWINVPYFGGDATDRYAVVEGRQLSVGEFLNHADRAAITPAQLEAIQVPEIALMEGAPPCLQHLARAGFPAGTRNNGLFCLGVFAKRAYGDEWERRLDEMNQLYLDPPLPSKEVHGATASLKRKSYSYKCKDQPIVGCCNRVICLTRAHGVGGGGGDDPGVVFGGLTKVDTRPPTWIVDVDGHRMELRRTESLLSQEQFRASCVEVINRLPNKVKPYVWEALVQRLLEKLEVVEAPADASADGQLLGLLEAFLTDKAQAASREELLLGKPWREDGHYHFRSSDFLKYLERSRFREAGTTRETWAALRKAGARSGQFNLKGKCVRVWTLPEGALTRVEDDLEVPRIDAPEEDF